MKNQKNIWIGAIIIVLVLMAWLFLKWNTLKIPSTTSTALVTNLITHAVKTPPATNSTLTNITGSIVSTNLAAAYQAYKEGKISKDALITAGLLSENSNPQDFYGKVIDQYSQPVVGARVTGWVTFLQGMDSDEKREAHKTETDAEGLFQFTGLIGASISADVAKEGYEVDYRVGYKVPAGEKTSPDNRAILTMWKLKGAEPMVHSQIEVGIPCDGTQRKFDLLTGHRVENGGDLTVSFSRDPVNIVRGKHFDWKLVLDVPQGGLFEITDLYPNEAPAEGYHPDVVIDMPADTNGWSSSFRESYYLESRDGKVFGRVTVHLTGDYEPPPTHFEIDAYLNPGGSHNLEIDQSRVTRVGNGNF